MQKQKLGGLIMVNGTLLLLVIVWSIPTIGLLVSSFRTRFDIATTGWWNVFPHREWQTVKSVDPKQLGLDPNTTMTVEGATGTFDQLRAGVEAPDGKTRVTWVGNKRLGTIEVQQRVWTVSWDFTLDNYKQVLLGSNLVAKNPDGTTETLPGQDMSQAFLNSLAVSIPSTVIPILIAAFAAYAFAWMHFPGRRVMFILVVGLLVVPLQIALVPILRDYNTLNLNGTFLGVWLAHTGFGLALATYLLFNYISTLPRETLESAFIDGASHFTIFQKLILPLSVPALASFAIFQFLWVWNDYLVALTFLGVDPSYKVLTQRLADLTGT
ncbi:MAG: carbohydrate ABC transporter permease, partial [Anaerolineae bacterium]